MTTKTDITELVLDLRAHLADDPDATFPVSGGTIARAADALETAQREISELERIRTDHRESVVAMAAKINELSEGNAALQAQRDELLRAGQRLSDWYWK